MRSCAQLLESPRGCETRTSLKARTRGFTIFELMIVVMIIMIVLMVAVPSVGRVLETLRLDGSASMLHNKIMEARINAIKRNRSAWLQIDAVNLQVQVQTTDNVPATINVGDPGLLQKTVGFQAGSPFEVRFDSMGRPVAPRTFVLETSNMQKTITVTATGRITVN